MRASDTERERIAERLRDAAAEGRLTMEEFEERLDTALRARTRGELEPLVQDLPEPAATPAPGAFAPAEEAGSRSRWAERIGGPATSRNAFAFWGGFSRKGRWTVPRRFTAFAMMAGGDLDLREARFEDRVVEIRCFAIMGGIDVIAPPGLNVDVTGAAFMGEFADHGADTAPDPSSPRVRVTGFALMGGVDVKHRRTRAEKQRLKAERERERELERERKRLEKGGGGPRKELD
ncbi:DUF1707 SHOCT-like domain-containing protein [Streptomyces sp. NPDC001985]|uniref:DUF1707 SHOCT-like domain-containing protein n=1 Tax=Streptomyces sp. NPDC001985 TaxID=3154406 RepID=UPI00331E1B84